MPRNLPACHWFAPQTWKMFALIVIYRVHHQKVQNFNKSNLRKLKGKKKNNLNASYN